LLDYQCGHCGRVFNAFTESPLQGIRRPPAQLLLILRGVAQATPTAQLARELGCDRKHLLQLRHRLQANARLRMDRTRWTTPWSTPMRRMSTRGKRGIPHPDPADAPRRRGHGTFANDRPPIAGVVGRESGEVCLEVIESASGAELEEVLDDTCLKEVVVNTDEWKGYSRVGRQRRRAHQTVDYSAPRAPGRWTSMATVSARCIATRRRVCGRGCGTSCACSGV
jgi:ISXO2 transposase-like protein